MRNVEQTIISQYGESSILRQLISNMNSYIDPSADIENFLSFVWDIDTAQGFGLDILGDIVGVSRLIPVAPSITEQFLGFKNTGNQPWGQAPFYNKAASSNIFSLSDDAFRTLIKLKALANITRLTIPAINQMLLNLFAGRGRCYVTDQGNMGMTFVFEFALEPFEISILTQGNALPTPTGVLSNVMQTNSMTFGFKQQAGAQPFNQGNFFYRGTGLIPVA